jgi:hypothetical protein
VVALFPMGLETLRRFFDLGGVGFGSFKQAGLVPKVPNSTSSKRSLTDPDTVS